MNEKFFDLPEEKRNAIIDAGLYVFSRNSYRHATTDEITRRAGISKGLLFHYFGNKKGFYTYLYDYSIAFLTEHTLELHDKEETDFFKIFADAQSSKMSIMYEHADLVQFIVNAYLNAPDDAKPETDATFQAVADQSVAGFLMRVDRSLFKDDITLEQALDIVLWMSEGYMRTRTPEQLEDLVAVNEEFMQYLDILRKRFYKEDYL